MRSRLPALAIFISFAAAPATAAEPAVKLPITRDTRFSGVGDEADGNSGGASMLKVKSIQELSLLDFDPAPLKGRVVARATLHLKSASPQNPLRRVTVGTFAAEWEEGTAAGYKPEKGASTFNRRKHPDEPWAYPGGSLNEVMLGRGGTIWRMADATPPDADGWQTVAVEPAVVMARVAGVSYGLLVFDDTGSEWTRNGETFTQKMLPNRFIFSKEAGPKSAPFLTVELGPADTTPPDAPTAVAAPVFPDRRPPIGDGVDVYWATPADTGWATVGFHVEVDGKPVPRYLIPAAGDVARMRLRPGDVPLRPPGFAVTVRAVDGAGNVGPPLELRQEFAGWGKRFEWNVEPPHRPNGAGRAPKFGAAEVFVVDPLDKIHPVTGAMTPPQADGYLTTNHLWHDGSVSLDAARNEFVGFQIVLRGAVEKVSAELEFDPPDDIGVSFYRYVHVPSRNGPLPDPLVPLRGPFAVPTPEEKIAGQKSGSLLAEVYVGHGATPGKRKGRLKLRAGKQTLDVPVALMVRDFSLPDRLSFVPEMNCYELPADELEYYRLAHWHRTVVNRVPYTQRGEVFDGCAPVWDGKAFDWTAWDARFGPLLDGKAFADLPRKRVPLELFYLPLHENWPAPMAGNYNGSYWADAAFPPRYRDTFVQASRAFAAHFSDRGWSGTLFQGFLNNKVEFKQKGWSRASSPWTLDEPVNWQDYWALKWFGDAFHEGVWAAGPGGAKMRYRCDISRPEWQRDGLDAVLDCNVVAGAAFHQHHRMIIERRDRLGQTLTVYGGTNAVEANNTQPVGWCLDAWTLGADGVEPWQTIGTLESWKKADELSLFYPGRPVGLRGPVPSVRLKAYLRGQQDVEYLALLEASSGASRRAIGEAVRAALKLNPVWQRTDRAATEDAGVIQFGDLKPQDLWALRTRVAAELGRLKVKPAPPLTAAPVPERPATLASPGKVSGVR
ncbi:glycoside hydrolase domain-containing protein [Fimbriiglobus ruber]|uniref:Uncharacterized protein n=1 Tax=Fimbriiglobus ruber TaxID=1908690 RepID=A0A225D546_9BACT|nr:glycoside hydrolase domain-containing protein [Fimbriiglobus ruber]OWK36073.1 hypothetical protein FRUB_08636 [Fimbriiglobus ruber]